MHALTQLRRRGTVGGDIGDRAGLELGPVHLALDSSVDLRRAQFERKCVRSSQQQTIKPTLLPASQRTRQVTGVRNVIASLQPDSRGVLPAYSHACVRACVLACVLASVSAVVRAWMNLYASLGSRYRVNVWPSRGVGSRSLIVMRCLRIMRFRRGSTSMHVGKRSHKSSSPIRCRVLGQPASKPRTPRRRQHRKHPQQHQQQTYSRIEQNGIVA